MSFLDETAPEMLAPNPTARCDGFSDGLNCLGETYGLQARCKLMIPLSVSYVRIEVKRVEA